jgi:tetratricopeptide (TPR) repeat protein
MALSLNTNCAAAYYSRGLSFKETGQLDKADADIEKAFQINPDLGKK